MFFNKKWSDVNDNDVKNLAYELELKMGGWIFHEKVNFDYPTPHLNIDRGHPKYVKKWIGDK